MAIAGVSEVLGIFCGKILPGVCNATVRSYCCTAVKYSTTFNHSRLLKKNTTRPGVGQEAHSIRTPSPNA